MHEFFKPWRRKIGVLTLGLALMFMVVWANRHFERKVIINLVFPLTIVSAYLLRSKPRPAMTKDSHDL